MAMPTVQHIEFRKNKEKVQKFILLLKILTFRSCEIAVPSTTGFLIYLCSRWCNWYLHPYQLRVTAWRQRGWLPRSLAVPGAGPLASGAHHERHICSAKLPQRFADEKERIEQLKKQIFNCFAALLALLLHTFVVVQSSTWTLTKLDEQIRW